MKTKATHTGTCQICGSRQKLPKGVMAKHGYTVEFGWFNGVCPGSGNLPFEQSCELVKKYIEINREAKANVEKRIDAVLADNGATEKVFVYTYSPSRGSVRGGYYWLEVEVTEQKNENSGYAWTTYHYMQDGKSKKIELYNSRLMTLPQVRNHLNELYIKEFLLKRCESLQAWIDGGVRRVESWKLEELQPVE